MVTASRELGLEGVILRRMESQYHPGARNGEWQKIRNLVSADIVIGGWLPGTGARSTVVASVLAGILGPAGLDYADSVGSGFTRTELRDLTARLLRLDQPASPFAGPVPAAVARRARWTRPFWRPRSRTLKFPGEDGCAIRCGGASAQASWGRRVVVGRDSCHFGAVSVTMRRTSVMVVVVACLCSRDRSADASSGRRLPAPPSAWSLVPGPGVLHEPASGSGRYRLATFVSVIDGADD